MAKFDGQIDGFRAAVSSVSPKGEWSSTGGKETYRARSGEIVNLFLSTGTIQFQGTKNIAFEQAVLAACEKAGSVLAPPVEAEVSEEKRVFIVHGHDKMARTQLELLLYKLDLKPLFLQD